MCSAWGSMTMETIIGESGHPCLIPFLIGKEDDINPEDQTLADGCEYSVVMAASMPNENPNLERTVRM